MPQQPQEEFHIYYDEDDEIFVAISRESLFVTGHGVTKQQAILNAREALNVDIE